MTFWRTILWMCTCGLLGREETEHDDLLRQPLVAGQSNGVASGSQEPSGDLSGHRQTRPPPVSTKNILGLGHRDVNDDYELGELIGQGAFAVVQRCRNLKTNDTYACKTVNKSKLRRRADVEDIRREVQILMMLSGHPNVASLVGIYENEEAVHMILELCEGGELLDEICSRGTESERDAAKYFRSMVSVVQHCHTLGIMHRDIKPENFLLSIRGPGGIVKAADFGLSQFFRPGRPLHSLVGSAHFVAPEVIKRNYGPAADVWSLGVCLYVLLSGMTPFWGDTEEEVLDMVLTADIDYTSEPWPSISKQAKAILKRMLDRNPAKRPTPQELLQHAWLCHAQPDQPLKPIVVERLRSMAIAIRVKRAAMLAATKGLLPEHLPKLHQVFAALDIDQSGTLSAKELRVGLQRLNLGLPAGTEDALIASADLDHDGKVSLEEFITATLKASTKGESKEHEAILQQLDGDGDGILSNRDVEEVLVKYGATTNDVRFVLKALDAEGKGYVTINAMSKWLVAHGESLRNSLPTGASPERASYR